MALIQCPECEAKVSDKAEACIHCGCPLRVDDPESKKTDGGEEEVERPQSSVTVDSGQEAVSQKPKNTVKTRHVVLGVIGAILLAFVVFWLNATGTVCLSHNWVSADCSDPRHCIKCGLEDGDELNPDRHSWNEADCRQPRHCADCGITDGEINPENHAWHDATCTAPMTCWKCAKMEGEPTGHQWGDESEDGSKTCVECGMVQVGKAKVEALTTEVSPESEPEPVNGAAKEASAASGDGQAEKSKSASSSDKVVGSWHAVGLTDAGSLDYSEYVDDYSDIDVTFKGDGTVTMTIGTSSYPGTWWNVSGDGVEGYGIDLGSSGGVWVGLIDDDVLVLISYSDENVQVGFVR